MTYSKIEIVAPSSAEAGALVDLEVVVENITLDTPNEGTFSCIPVLRINGLVLEGSYEAIVPGETRSWYFQFTMPEESVTIIAESWCEDTFEWHLDDTDQINIALAGLPSLGPLALVGGLGLLVVGAAVAFAASPKE